MKRKRGRPKGKSYPEPHATHEGFDIANYGKLGASEAMALLRDCPYPTIDFVQKSDLRSRNRTDRKHLPPRKAFLKMGPKLKEIWLRRVGPILGEKIAGGDGEFFRQLGDAVEEFSKSRRPDSFRRLLAIECKVDCDFTDTPFTCKVLSDYYKRHNPADLIDSSTLSKIRRWAQSAKFSLDGMIQEFGPRPRIRVRPENRILKP